MPIRPNGTIGYHVGIGFLYGTFGLSETNEIKCIMRRLCLTRQSSPMGDPDFVQWDYRVEYIYYY